MILLPWSKIAFQDTAHAIGPLYRSAADEGYYQSKTNYTVLFSISTSQTVENQGKILLK